MFNFRKIVTANTDLQRVQTNVDDVFKQLRNAPILDGVLVENVIIGTTATSVSHTLQRQPRGFIIVDINADARVRRSAWTPTTLSLISTATVTLSLWVF